MREKVVFDRSVLIAALKTPDGAAHEFLRRAGQEFEIALSVPLVLEYEEAVRARGARISVSPAELAQALDHLCVLGVHHRLHYLWRPVLRDWHADAVLEVAVLAEAYTIVTFRPRAFRGTPRSRIVLKTPAAYLRRCGK